MTRIALSPEQLNAQAAGPAVSAANAAIREAGPDTTWSPMGAMPPVLLCEGRHRVRVVVRDRHGTPHITSCCYVREAREAWHYAHPEDLHVRRVPSDLEFIPLRLAEPDGPGEAVLDAGELGGQPFAPAFAAYLQEPHEPIVRAMREMRRKCAGHHRERPEHRGRPVCATLLWSVIANGNRIEDAAEAVELTPERASALLFEALRVMWTWRAQGANGI